MPLIFTEGHNVGLFVGARQLFTGVFVAMINHPILKVWWDQIEDSIRMVKKVIFIV